ncbi:Mediator of RNA polymerase II transcription subunit 35a [Intoshia linei]|uniref:Mediator of RNA polymerase II transcription subunit 35a n=1 Tax=Intoshia linei TaxID=1819745 RepID=A0A177BA88_9BILA|nr:Mediator of RNA polymerase II transcription subunit 35a [Intoshia linei]
MEKNIDDQKSNWTEHKSPDGRLYYYNYKLKKSVWHKPNCLKTKEEILISGCHWKEHKAENGKSYYYNTETKQSSWLVPPEFDELKQNISELNKKEEEPTIGECGVNIVKDGSKMTESMIKTLAAINSSAKEAAKQNGDDEIDMNTLMRDKEKAIDALFKLFERKNVPSNATWDDAHKLISMEPIFSILKNLTEKRQVLQNYKVEKGKKERIEAREKLKESKAILIKFLLTCKDVTSNSKYSQVEDRYGHLSAWKDVGDRFRYDVFEDALDEIAEKEKEENRQKRQHYFKDFNGILENIPDVKYNTKWSDFQNMLGRNKSFLENRKLQEMDKEDALICFEDYIRKLEDEYEDGRAKERTMIKRNERIYRDKYKELLKSLHKEGKLCSLSLWTDLFPEISQYDEYYDTLGNSGQTSLDIFKFFVESLKKSYNHEKRIIKSILKEHGFLISLTTTLEEFIAMIEKSPQGLAIDRGNARLAFNSFIEKAKSIERERVKEHQRKIRKLESAFIKILKDSNLVKVDTKWDSIRSNFITEEAFKKLQPECERERVFAKYLDEMKNGKPKKKKRKRYDSSGSDRKRKHNYRSDSDDHSRRKKKKKKIKKKKHRKMSEEISESELEIRRKLIVEQLNQTALEN